MSTRRRCVRRRPRPLVALALSAPTLSALAPIGLAPAAAPPIDEAAAVRFLREHAVPMRSVAPDDEDFTDLEPLVGLIGDARIVALGEQTHGDGTTFLAKARLVKFLHQRMGFDLLVWESGLVELERVNAALHEGVPAHEAARLGVFPIWTESDQVRPLLDYVTETFRTDRPLEMAGFDCQGIRPETAGEVIEETLDVLDGADPPGSPLPLADRNALRILATRMTEQPPSLDRTVHEDFQAAVSRALERLEQIDGERAAMAHRSLVNLRALETMFWHYLVPEGEEKDGLVPEANGHHRRSPTLRAALVREPAMAENLVWLARERYPDRRMILWAASSHLMHGSTTVEMDAGDGTFRRDTDPWRPMGDAVRKVLGESIYTVGFIAGEGTIGTATSGRTRAIGRAPAGSLEELCRTTGHDLLFVDLRTLPALEGGAWLGEPLVARPRGYAVMRTRWPGVCDAMIYTERMIPSTRHIADAEARAAAADGPGR